MSLMDGHKQATGTNTLTSNLRGLPSVDRVLGHPAIKLLREHVGLPKNIVTMAIREELEEIRQSVLNGNDATPTLAEVVDQVSVRALGIVAPSIKHVINATGVIIHTNLGRAPLSQAAPASDGGGGGLQQPRI